VAIPIKSSENRAGNLLNAAFLDYFRCPDTYVDFRLSGQLSENAGYFRWGKDTVCYGHSAAGFRAREAREDLYNISDDIMLQESGIVLPFDPEEIVENLQREHYAAHFRQNNTFSGVLQRNLYYILRPYLGVSVRKHLQRLKLYNWKSISFPEWPVDCTVDRIHRRLMALVMRANGLDTMPFVWFWPDGFTSCTIITHDVEDV